MAASKQRSSAKTTAATAAPADPEERSEDQAAADEAFAGGVAVETKNFENAENAETPDIAGPVRGFVDGVTRRTGGEVMEGHFCTIDRTHKGLDSDLADSFGGTDGYGVYVGPAKVGDDGYPELAKVRLRDASSALIVVPYAAITAAEAGRR